MTKLFINCKYEGLKGNTLLNKYQIKKLSEKNFVYKIENKFYTCELQPKKISNLDVGKVIFLKIEAMRDAINIAIKNNHDQLAEELIKDVLKTADVNLALF
ncbi:hypothetical protein [Candidatus Rickettsia kedanie]|uniref:Uncharacterized protein n=1 Tax=Candidatus Rickettsia kedanie TaxID=3115352 RepID=A0ABP9TS05_9RICK